MLPQHFALNGLYVLLLNCCPEQKNFSNCKDLFLIFYICLQCRKLASLIFIINSKCQTKPSIQSKCLLGFKALLHEDVNSQEGYLQPNKNTVLPNGF